MFIGTLVVIALLSAAGVVALEAPVRSALALLLCVLAVGGLAWAGDAPEVAGLVLWVLGAGVGLLLLTTILLLNLTPDEVGGRRLSVRRSLSLVVLAWTGAGATAIVLESAPVRAAQAAIPRGTAARAALEDHGIVLALAFLSLVVAVVGALLVARRRA